MAGVVGVIWGGEEEEYFLMEGLTGNEVICPSGKWGRRKVGSTVPVDRRGPPYAREETAPIECTVTNNSGLP